MGADVSPVQARSPAEGSLIQLLPLGLSPFLPFPLFLLFWREHTRPLCRTVSLRHPLIPWDLNKEKQLFRRSPAIWRQGVTTTDQYGVDWRPGGSSRMDRPRLTTQPLVKEET